jgi:muramoyltetrapeptide carboxypeptidase
MSPPLRIGVTGASSAIPQIEFSLGIEHLRNSGFEVRVHPQTAAQSFTFAGNDEQRAGAFFEYASDPSLDILWLARGGYGATRILPLLDRLAKEKGVPPRKLLIGYSDVTALHAYVHAKWNWPTLHAPMPAAADFPDLNPADWMPLLDLIRGKQPGPSWLATPLRFLHLLPREAITAPLQGGNLTVYNCLTGTPYAPSTTDSRILFFEDVDEAPYRLDRMIAQLIQSGAFANVRAVILGDFTNCTDTVSDYLSADPRVDPTASRKPLRKLYSKDEALVEVFSQLQPLGIPVAAGLPVGHGPHFSPLPLNATYTLTPAGHLKLNCWDWKPGE